MTIPKYNGRPMEIVKKYPSFILFKDVKTGIRMAFSYFELNLEKTKQLREEILKQYRRTPYDKVKIDKRKRRKTEDAKTR